MKKKFNEKSKFIAIIFDQESLLNWEVEYGRGREGLCLKDQMKIIIGKKAKGSYFKWLVLHEITHALIDNHHYSNEFRDKMNELCKKYKIKCNN